MPVCNLDTAARDPTCRNTTGATHLKLVSIIIIFLTSVIGIASPVILSKSFQGNKPLYNKSLLIIKCFAAGVILSTSLVHVLPDAFDALASCVVSTRHPWKDFPFSGLVTLIGALLALLVDIMASSHMHGGENGEIIEGDNLMGYSVLEKVVEGNEEGKNGNFEVVKEGKKGNLMVDDEGEGKKGKLRGSTVVEEEDKKGNFEMGVVVVKNDGGGEAVGEREEEEEMVKKRQRMVSQVLEIGIIFHSVIIGVTMGMSQNTCTIKPLVAALAFHQIFEGMGLGGCIAQAGFSFKTTFYMGFMFSVTTPLGIVLGMIVFSATGYDDSSPNALIFEGLLGSLSSGILIYMALVDLISADFFHNKMMNSHDSMKKACFVALCLGSTSMSILALWA